MPGLTERQMWLLVASVRKHDPDAEFLIGKLGIELLTVDERERLRKALADELVAAGLDENDEHTSLGKELDDIIGALHAYAPDD